MDGRQLHREFDGAGCLVPVLAVSAAGCGYALYYLMTLGSGWIATAVAILIVEPIGLACLFGIVVILAPHSFAAQLFHGALRRAGLAVAILGLLFVGVIVGLFAFVIWDYSRM